MITKVLDYMIKKIMICSKCGKKVISVYPVGLDSFRLGFLCRTCRIDFFSYFIRYIYCECENCRDKQQLLMNKYMNKVKKA
jgi:hypothetical protein